jgi:molybdenum cofactor guanylyltransferase
MAAVGKNVTTNDLKSQMTGLILAGGLGRRMGGVDKGLQLYQSTPLVSRVLQRLKPQVASVMISANRHLDKYQALAPGFSVWADLFPDYAGPLAGILTGLTHCPTPYLLTVPCDAPHVPLDLVERLAEPLLHNASLDLSFASTQQTGHYEPQHGDQPLFCLLKTTLLHSLTLFLNQGGRAVYLWQAQQRAQRVFFADAHAFANINELPIHHS